MTVFFTSDTHFGHKNIIKYCNRPFQTAYEMDEAMIANWNSVVKPTDTIYHLGDFGFTHADKIVNVLKRLNGKKIFIMGNHDKQMRDPSIRPFFEEMTNYKEIYVRNKQKVVLSHYPFASWNGSFHGSFHLHGHCHNTYFGAGRIMDAGVDAHNFTPISYDEVEKRLLKIADRPNSEKYGERVTDGEDGNTF
jgi:calcineurin-like phosphoesterase family protein